MGLGIYLERTEGKKIWNPVTRMRARRADSQWEINRC